MDTNAFARQFPKLYHLTFAANLPSIREHGLLSARDLADRYSFSEEDRAATLGSRRLCNQDLHGITLRDQQAASESKMKTCLVRISIPEWLALLNSKIFFFVTEDKAMRMAEAYSDYANLLLAVDTKTLLTRHGEEATLCRIVSGSFLHPRPRGRDSFIPLATYSYKNKRDTPAELTISTPIPDILSFSTVVSPLGEPGH
jgi:hypothetical protein